MIDALKSGSAENAGRASSILLMIAWVAGLLLGGVVAAVSQETLSEAFRTASLSGSTLSGIVLPSLLPFLLSALAVYFSAPKFLTFICGVKAFSFAFCGFGLCFVYGQCSWLIRLLLMFTDVFSLPILYFYWTRYSSGERRPSWITNICIFCILLVISSIDHCFISPFTVYLVKN